MLEIRPIVVNSDMIVLGGNMRLKACKEAGLKEIPIIFADDLTEEQQREFIIKDNVGFGEWDWEIIANEWKPEQLEEWGLDIPDFEDFSNKNDELNLEDLESKMTKKLSYSEDDYYKVKDALEKISSTPESAVYKLLGL
jgi:hypothetical protein